jgi:phage gp46-like protein
MDIALTQVGTAGQLAFDITLVDGYLAGDDGMRTAVIISLFSDARAADDDELPNPGGDRRGWWADTYAPIPGDVTGSKLWLLARSKNTPDVLAKAQQYARDALAWLVEDGIASGIAAVASFPQLGWFSISVTINRPAAPSRGPFDFVWQNS